MRVHKQPNLGDSGGAVDAKKILARVKKKDKVPVTLYMDGDLLKLLKKKVGKGLSKLFEELGQEWLDDLEKVEK